MKQNNSAKKILQLLLLFIYFGFYASITLFPHIHHIDSVSIVHSHPLKSSANNPLNNHSKDELIFIQIVTTFLITFLFIYFITEKTGKVIPKKHFHNYIGKIPEFNSINSQGRRAPPEKDTN